MRGGLLMASGGDEWECHLTAGVMSSPDDVSSAAVAGARPRHYPPHRDKRGASADRGGVWDAAGGDGSPTLSTSRASLNSNRDSGYVPSPAGAVRFDLDSGDAEFSSPSSVPPRPVTRPITIPFRPSGLPPPEESVLLRRRQRRQRLSSSEDEGTGDAEDRAEDDTLAREEGGAERRQREELLEFRGQSDSCDTVDRAQPVDEVELLFREARRLQVGWREGAVLPPGFTFRAELPDIIPARAAPPEDAADAGAALVSASAPASRRRRPTSRASSASLTVELDVGQELREIADSLPLSRSAPGALQPRRDIWTLIRRTFDFGIRREMPPRPRRTSQRQ